MTLYAGIVRDHDGPGQHLFVLFESDKPLTGGDLANSKVLPPAAKVAIAKLGGEIDDRIAQFKTLLAGLFL